MSSWILNPKNRKNDSNYPNLLLEKLREIESSNSFISSSIDGERFVREIKDSLRNSSLPLSGWIFSIKDLISTTEGFVTGGSKFLEKYTPPFNSSVYLALRKAGAVNLVNSNLDEFGLGWSGLNGFNGAVENPIDPKRIVGGSSSGSAYLVRKGLVDFSICSDTGDSARYPASCCGIFGFKPTYGLISRYGFYSFCSSFDTPSIMASSVRSIAEVLSVISFSDPHDLCTLSTSRKDYSKSIGVPISRKLKIAILNGTFWSSLDRDDESKEIEGKFNDLVGFLRDEKGIEVELYDFPHDLLKLSGLIYKVVAFSESISNYSNLTGLLFPYSVEKSDSESGEKRVVVSNKDNGKNYEEIVRNNRESLGEEFVYRQLLGMHFLDGKNYDEIYLKCKKLLTKINEEVAKLYEEFDLVISPSDDSIPIEVAKYSRGYSNSNIKNIMVLPNFCSLPAISIPWIEVRGMPIGLHVMAKSGEDEFLLQISDYFVSILSEKKNN